MAGKTEQKKLQWVRLPMQRRSDASLQRILDAAEQIMERKSFSEITVAEIVKKARSSVGVFYSRFPDKLALLHHLDERFAQSAEEAINRQLRYEDWKDCSFPEVSREIIEFLCRSHSERKGMLKSIILKVRLDPNQRFQQTGKRLIQVVNRIAEFLLNWQQEIAHPYPDRAVRFALVMVISLIREFIVFSETTLYQDLLDLDPKHFPEWLSDFFLRMVNGPDMEWLER